ncbi:MAG: hypothetical protein HUU55_11335, partial [Myxococcales bacterium]|nr:hypothetical protein [Myxococcales bacterium]
MLFRKPIWVTVMLLAGIIGCGSDDGGSSSSKTDTASTSDTAAADTAAPTDMVDTSAIDTEDSGSAVDVTADAVPTGDIMPDTAPDGSSTTDVVDDTRPEIDVTQSDGSPNDSAVDDTVNPPDDTESDISENDVTSPADAGLSDSVEQPDQAPWIPPTFACKKNGDCVLQFPNLPPCEVASCNLDTGDCEVIVLADNEPCSDGDPCSTGDRCIDGACTPTAQNCDDDNDCTDDVCFPGLACLNQYNTNPCDDLDTCTTDDRCIQGECSGDVVYCNDQDTCTQDYCVAGDCTYLPLPTPACCFTKVAGWTFDDGTLGGYTATNPSIKVGWKTIENQYYKSPFGSLYFGDTKNVNYDDAGAPVSGVVISQPFLLPTAGVVSVTMDAFLDIEQTVVKDRLWIYLVFSNGEKEEIWFKSSKTEISQWTEINIDLTPYLGEVVRLEYQFDSVDGTQNSGKGVFIDDIRVIASCPEEPCAQDFDCDDGVLCTADSCEFSACVHVFVENCCVSNADCNDGNVCTTDQCQNNLCQHPLNTKPCNDKDPCTWKDQCAQGSCAGVPLPCDDKDNCTLDSCQSGVCTFEPSGSLQCCHKEISQFGFDTGNLTPWITVQSPGTPGWHPSSLQAATFPYSARFGALGQYSVSGKAATGILQSPMVPLPPLPALEVRFWAYMEVESAATVDILRLVGTSPAGKSIVLWEKPANFPMQQWVWVKAPAEFFATAGGIELQFVFDTIDNVNNSGEGVYVDDIRLFVPCTDLVCTGPGDSQCDDGAPETTDSCIGGQCQSDALLWYCESDADCDDHKFCTDQLCVANTCQFMTTPGCCDDDEQCLDADPCTQDVCSTSHECTHPPIAGSCDDADPCTTNDQCKNGTCVGQIIQCDDQNSCTTESCVAGDCTYTLVNKSAECCNFVLVDEPFSTNLTASGWKLTNSNSKAGWNQTSVRFSSPPSALYFGDPSTLSYNAGLAKGTAESPAFTLPNATDAFLEFALWLDVEQSLDYDVFFVEAAPVSGGAPTVLLTKPSKPPTQQFQKMSLPLTQFAGQTIKIRFIFDTIDASTNHREGVVIDDLRIWIGCPKPACAADNDCDDGNVCTTDSCIDNTCAHVPTTGCCTQNVHCDDMNPCTTDTCTEGQCFYSKQPNCCQSAADCDDQLVCTTDQCDQSKGCTHTQNTLACNDFDPCTEGDTCTAGKCIGTKLGCDDGDLLCTVDTCKYGQCIHIPTGQTNCCISDADCDDSDPCTDTTCGANGVCTVTQLCCAVGSDCNDGDSCTADICVAQTCVAGQTTNPACCDETVWFADFDNGNDGHEFTNANNKVGWFVITTGPSQSSPGALGFSDPTGNSMGGVPTYG